MNQDNTLSFIIGAAIGALQGTIFSNTKTKLSINFTNWKGI